MLLKLLQDIEDTDTTTSDISPEVFPLAYIIAEVLKNVSCIWSINDKKEHRVIYLIIFIVNKINNV